MRKYVLNTIFCLLISYSLKAQWNYAGEKGFSEYPIMYTSLKVNPLTEEPYIAFSDGWRKASVMKYNGSSWEFVGKPSFSEGIVDGINLAFSKSGVPYVVFTDSYYDKKVSVLKYNGSEWVYVGTPGLSESAGTYPSIDIDMNDTPYIAFRDFAHNYGASIMKYISAWTYVGNPGFTDATQTYGGALNLSLTLDKNGVPYIAYQDFTNNFITTVQRYSGTNWQLVGTPGFASWNAEWTKSMAFDSKNRLYTVCAVSGRVTVMRFEDGSWTPVGNPSFSQGGAEYATITIDKNDVPYVAFQDYGVNRKASVMKIVDSTWTYVDHQGITPSSVTFTSMDVDNKGNIFVGFADESATYRWNLSVMKYATTIIDLNDEKANSTFNIYPNPSGSAFTVSYEGEVSEVTINVQNQIGQIISTKHCAPQKDLKETFNLKPQSKGVYFVEVISDKSREVKKIVIE